MHCPSVKTQLVFRPWRRRKGNLAPCKGRSSSENTMQRHHVTLFHAYSNRKQYKWFSLPTVVYQMQWMHINPCVRNAFEVSKPRFLGHRTTHGPLAITHGKNGTRQVWRKTIRTVWNDEFIGAHIHNMHRSFLAVPTSPAARAISSHGSISRLADSIGGMKCASISATQSAAASWATNGDHTRHQTQPSATSATPARWKTKVDVAKCHACHVKRRWMSPSATPATQSAAAWRATNGDQVRHQTQPSVTSATPATQMLRPCRQVPRLPRKCYVHVAKCHACHAKCVTKLCVKDGVWKMVCDKVVCVCDKVVCERWCVTKMVCDKEVCDKVVCVWKIVCDKEMCDKVVCERWCVTKRCVTKFVLKDGVWQCCVEEAAAAEAAAEAEERDTESKTRTPHKDVGNKEDCWTAKNLSVPGLDWPRETQQYRPLEPRFGHSFLQFWSSAATNSPWTGFQNPLQFRWRLSWFRSACQIPPGWRYLSPNALTLPCEIKPKSSLRSSPVVVLLSWPAQSESGIHGQNQSSFWCCTDWLQH